MGASGPPSETEGDEIEVSTATDDTVPASVTMKLISLAPVAGPFASGVNVEMEGASVSTVHDAV